jgi:hypothetical protein
MAAAVELVGIGEFFADPHLAIGLALRLRDMGLSARAQGTLIEAGERFLDERGLLDAEPAPNVDDRHEVLVHVAIAAADLTTKLLAAGLKPRVTSKSSRDMEFSGLLGPHSPLPDKSARRSGGCGGGAVLLPRSA